MIQQINLPDLCGGGCLLVCVLSSMWVSLFKVQDRPATRKGKRPFSTPPANRVAAWKLLELATRLDTAEYCGQLPSLPVLFLRRTLVEVDELDGRCTSSREALGAQEAQEGDEGRHVAHICSAGQQPPL